MLVRKESPDTECRSPAVDRSFMPDIGLYVHVPFCPRKCGYCDFYSTVPAGDECERLIWALLAELDRAFTARSDLRVETIFVGGGTPTFLPVPALERLLARLGRIAVDHGVTEFTVEANPGSLGRDRASVLRANGVNRVSMGAQSFNEAELAVLDRVHSPADIAAGAEVVHRAGFEHFNLDLIFGIPGQTPATWRESLQRAIRLGPDHLACYGLTFEPGTPLHDRLVQGRLLRVAEEMEAELYTAGVAELGAAGFEHYEISNFARPGCRCWHNLRYWHNLPVLGVGPAAASYLDGRRWRNLPDAAEYLRRMAAAEPIAVDEERLSPAERAGETAMLMLRLVEGIGCDEFRALTGFDAERLFAEAVARHAGSGRLIVERGRIRLTDEGRLMADSVILDFLSPVPRSRDDGGP